MPQYTTQRQVTALLYVLQAESLEKPADGLNARSTKGTLVLSSCPSLSKLVAVLAQRLARSC